MENVVCPLFVLVAHYTLVGVLINGYAVEARPGDGVTF
jgi:hypothetical protein